MRLLLAEDEKEMAHALEAVFTHNHYSVDVVYNGIDAADWAESGNYDGMIPGYYDAGKKRAGGLKRVDGEHSSPD